MEASISLLFRPFSFGDVTLPNRIVMAPMTRNHSPNGVPGQNVVNYHRRRAEGGTGPIVTERVVVPHIASNGLPGRPADGLTEVLAAFAGAAANAKTVGFDGVGIHDCLIDQFFRERTNRRSDEYGGSIENRGCFTKEIVAAVHEAVGADFPIVFRFSRWKMGDCRVQMAKTPEKLVAPVVPLADAGTDLFHAGRRRFREPEFEGSPLNTAGSTQDADLSAG